MQIYERYARGELPAGVAAMTALAAADSAADARLALAEAGDDALGLAPLLTEAAFDLVHAMLGLADHDAPASPETWGEVFDRAARLSPEASVALYSLGDPERLAAATREVVDWLDGEGLLGPGRRALEIGCGIGRFVAALAPRLALTVGIDVSTVMCAEAARRTAASHGAAVLRTDGRDLALFADTAFDLVLAIDSFPYLVSAGLAEAMTAEAARVLAPGGALIVLNWSYRGDAEADQAEAAALADALGLTIVERPTPALAHWDGAVHRFAKAC